MLLHYNAPSFVPDAKVNWSETLRGSPIVIDNELTELLMETYAVPELMYYVDGLASYYENCSRGNLLENNPAMSECLLISFGHQNSHLIPLTGFGAGPTPFRPMLSAARRLHVGGVHINWHVQRLLQLKYPCHTERINFGLAEYLLRDCGRLVNDYREELNLWRDRAYQEEASVQLQLPFMQSTLEDLNATADRRRAQSIRMQDLHRQKQCERLKTARTQLNKLLQLQTQIDKQSTFVEGSVSGDLSASVKRALTRFNLDGVAELTDAIHTNQSIVERLEQQMSTAAAAAAAASDQSKGSPMDTDNTFRDSVLLDTAAASSVSCGNPTLSRLFATLDATKSSNLTGRLKRAGELIISFALPAAVQAQMIAAPVSPADAKLSEAKFKQRLRLANELESGRTNDFLNWLMTIRNRRLKVAKRRTIRQSRIDLATEIGLHTEDMADLDGELDDSADDTKQTASVGPDILSSGVVHASRSGGESKSTMTERRRLQLERIRAMAAELKPSRPRVIKRRNAPDGAATTANRGKRMAGGNNSSKTGIKGPPSRGKSTLAMKPSVTDSFDAEVVGDEVQTEDLVGLEDNEESPLAVWDVDAEDSINADDSEASQHGSVPVRPIPVTLEAEIDDPGNESETERDQLAVLDTLLTLYDPEVAKEFGTTDLLMDAEKFYQIHVGTELIRSNELLFNPSFMGSQEAGLGDCFDFVLRDTRLHFTQSGGAIPLWPRRVFLTGGMASIPDLKARIYTELRSRLPYGSAHDDLDIVVAADPVLDAWRGARRWVATHSPTDAQCYLSRKQYEEMGSDYLMEHGLGNCSWSNPIVSTVT